MADTKLAADTRVCNTCSEEKPLDGQHFSSGKRTNKDGSVRRWFSGKCKACRNRQSNAAYRQRYPDKVRQHQRHKQRKRRSDPAKRGHVAEQRKRQREAEGRRRAEAEGRTYSGYTPRGTLHQNRQRALARQNARQAWQHWLYVKAPAWWLDQYYAASDKPWHDHRLSKSEAYRIRLRNDDSFRRSERARCRLKKRRRRAHQEIFADDTVDELAIRNERSRCPYCGRRLTKANTTLDHLDPIDQGGIHSRSNLSPCCKRCNSRKGSKAFLEWVDSLPNRHQNTARAMYKKKRGALPEQSTLPNF